MHTITVYDPGDHVRIKQDWRDWKKGESAIVEKFHLAPDPLHDDLVTLKSTTVKTHDFEILHTYMIEPDEKCPDCGRSKAKDAYECGAGSCPKWYAIRDADAERDCKISAANMNK